jgi:hypothetical protein
MKMKKNKQNIIDEWLLLNGNPEIVGTVKDKLITETINHFNDRIKILKEENNDLKGKIMQHRMDLKEKCKHKAYQIAYASAWHELDNYEYILRVKKCFVPLEEFDKHFNLTIQRYGSTV